MDLDYGQIIRICREEIGLTQKDLAEKAGIGIATIQRYESGSREPKISSLELIANALGFVSWQELLYNRRTGNIYGNDEVHIAYYGEVKPDMDEADAADLAAFKAGKIKALQQQAARPIKISKRELDRIEAMRTLSDDQLSMIDKMLGL